MPSRPGRHNETVRPAACADHGHQTTAQRGYGSRWQRYRLVYLAQHPLCVRCEQADRVTAATIVDHITPHRGDQQLFWDPGNHQSLCKPCHDEKTANEDGGFGRAAAAG